MIYANNWALLICSIRVVWLMRLRNALAQLNNASHDEVRSITQVMSTDKPNVLGKIHIQMPKKYSNNLPFNKVIKLSFLLLWPFAYQYPPTHIPPTDINTKKSGRKPSKDETKQTIKVFAFWFIDLFIHHWLRPFHFNTLPLAVWQPLGSGKVWGLECE